MKKLNNIAALFAVAASLTAGAVQAQTAAVPANVDNWRSSDGQPVRNGAGDLCWRDAFWTPATAHPACDGAPKPVEPAAVAPAPAAPAPAPAAAPVPAAPAAEKVSYAADAFFDFDKSVLKPEGKAKLDDLADKVKGLNLEVIIAVGHTDSVGTDAYNQKLSVRRSEAVKAYLVDKGIDANRVYTEGKGESQPVADNKSADGRAKNRRVEIEVVGTRTN